MTRRIADAVLWWALETVSLLLDLFGLVAAVLILGALVSPLAVVALVLWIFWR